MKALATWCAGALVLCVAVLGGLAVPGSALAATGSIAGQVTDASTHTGIQGVEVCAWKVSGSEAEEMEEHCAFSVSGGAYVVGSLAAGIYKVEFWPRRGGVNYVRQFYDGKRFWKEAAEVIVGVGQTPGIDAELEKGAVIEGRVTAAEGGAPIEEVLVCAFEEETFEGACEFTDADGKYSIIGLYAGEYEVEFLPEVTELDFVGQFYNGETTFGAADPVKVSAGGVASGIDADLETASEIRGTILSNATGLPLKEIVVCAARTFVEEFEHSEPAEELEFVNCAETNGSGKYAIGGLPSASYKVIFSLEFDEFFEEAEPENDGFPTRYWDEKNDLATSDTLAVPTASTITGIDARLGQAAVQPQVPIVPGPPPVTVLPKRHAHSAPTCKHGFVRKKVGGKYRCVKRHAHRHRHHHR